MRAPPTLGTYRQTRLLIDALLQHVEPLLRPRTLYIFVLLRSKLLPCAKICFVRGSVCSAERFDISFLLFDLATQDEEADV